MKQPILLLAFVLYLTALPGFGQMVDQVSDPVEWVNPLMGTDSKPLLSNGNTYPAIALPWGMNFWTPQTGRMGDGWAYTYAADRIRGFKQTHQPSPWMNDYGQFSIMPFTGKVKIQEKERASWFTHKSETVKPYYYSVYLADHNVTTEISPTERAAIFRITFPKTDSSYVLIDGFDKGSYIKLIPSENKVIGYTTRNSGGVPANFKNYFVVQFDKPFADSFAWKDSVIVNGKTELQDNHVGALVRFKTKNGDQIIARVASSFISPEQAELNLKELGRDEFDTIKEKGKDVWNKVLSRIKVAGGSYEQVGTFYSCLYRCVLFPQKHYEIDADGKMVHYSPYNGQVLPGYMFAGTGFWDTFRALYPFLNLAYPSINKEMQQGLINDYKEGGFLPEWSSPGYRNIMIGNNSASVVSDAYVKGLRDYDINTLYEVLVKGANNEGPMEAVGRPGVKYYNELGYVPYDIGIKENAARTLEYAYDDFAIYQLAKALNKPKKEIEFYAQRALNYRNLFDPATGLMRGKNKDGKFQSPFNPFKWGDAFTEGNSWHYTWSVFHDVEGLISLMGGKEKFVAKLDSVFSLPPIFDESYYRFVIHEIREMQIANMGQYAHGNQPIQHMPYLYNHAGVPWKTQYWTREIMNRLYKPTPDGYCGDEDNGQTSAWYVFSALGFYPVCPATDQYVMGAPLFKKVTLELENGKKVELNADNNNAENRFIKSMKLNGQDYTKTWISHRALLDGAKIDFVMANTPDKDKKLVDEDLPYSFSKENGTATARKDGNKKKR